MSRCRYKRSRQVYEVRTADRAPGDPTERVLSLHSSFAKACEVAGKTGGVTWVQSKEQ